MKKQLLLTVLSLCTATTLFAQTSPNQPNTRPGHQPVRMAAARNTSSSTERCIAVVNFNGLTGSFVANDSETYGYSGTRGSYFPHQFTNIFPWKFDNSYLYDYSTTTSAYSNEVKYTQTFDGNNNVTATLMQSWDVSTGSWVNYFQYSYTYDGMDNMLTYTLQSWNTTTAAWVNDYYNTFTYDTRNNLLTDIEQNWNTTSGAWNNYFNYTYTYDAMNNMLTATSLLWNTASSSYINYTMDTYTYDGMNDQLTDLYQTWNTTTGTWVNGQQFLFSSFVAPYPQLDIYQTWDSVTSTWVNYQEWMSTYDSYNELTYEYALTWNTASASWNTTPTASDDATRYYYQSYTSATQNSVPSITNTGGKALLYPVPAKNNLSIAVTWDEAQPFTAAVYDMQGRILTQWQVPATAQYNANIPVNNLPTGNYVIKMEGANCKIAEPFTVAN